MSVQAKPKPKPPLRRGGYYWIKNEQGVTVPLVSVTEALNEVAKQMFFVPAAIRRAHAAWSEDPGMSQEDAVGTWGRNMKRAANAGTLMHSFYEAHGRGAVLTPDQLPEQYQGHARAFLKWFEAVSPEIVRVEATVANPTYGYAGTGDLWAKVGGEMSIIDYKTGFLDEFSCAMQESAYERGEFGVDKATGERFELPTVTARYALQTREDGTYQWVQLPDRFQDFLGYLHVWRARHNEECFAACWCKGTKEPDPAYITVCQECAMPEGSVHLSECKYSVFRAFDGP